jgi:hypothetical protein
MVDAIGVQEAGLKLLESTGITKLDVVRFPNEPPNGLVHVNDAAMGLGPLGREE